MGAHGGDDGSPGRCVSKTIHVLHHGRAICGFSHDVPRTWPPGHVWVSTLERSDATCPQCVACAEGDGRDSKNHPMPPSPLRPYYKRHPDGTIEHVEDAIEWARWFEANFGEALRIARTIIDEKTGLEVSSVFLGIDHNFHFGDPEAVHRPILFETMTFRSREPDADGKVDREPICQWRWYTEQEALRAHEYIVTRLRENPDADLSDYEPLGAN